MHFSFSRGHSTIGTNDTVLKLHLFIQKQNLSMRDPPLVILSIAAADHKNVVVMKN